jgi:uncharacterized protein YybS (DUF2232 family)
MKRGKRMKNTRFITEGAVLLAVYIILLLASLYIPILNFFISLALPLPFILFSIRYDVKRSLILVAVASLVTMIVSSPLTITNTVMFGTAGIVFGSMYKRNRKPLEILLAGTLIYIVNIVVLYIVSIQLLHYNFITELKDVFNQSIQQAEQITKATGAQVNEEQMKQLKQTLGLIGYLLPMLVVASGLMMAWFTQLIAAPVLKRLRNPVQPWQPFRDIQFPKSVLWYYVLFLIITMFYKAEEGTYLYIALLNLNFLLQWIMAAQGFSFIAFWSHSKGYPKAFPIILFVVSLLMPILFSLVSFLGIIDLGFRLRNRLEKRV